MPAETASRRQYVPRAHRRERRTTSGIPLPRAADGRSVRARRFRDLVVAFELEVGGVLTESERAMIKQAAALTLRAEELQGDLILGKEIDNDLLIRLTGTARRILGSIGAKSDKRQAASGHDALAAHIAAKYGHRSGASAEAEVCDGADEIAAVAE
jgi:hypothetical protein